MEDDLSGRILEREDNVYEINFPCEAEWNDILGRKPGEALFPEIGKNDEWVKNFKRVFIKEEGLRAWNALFQGKAVAEGGNLVKSYWWKYWQPKGETMPPIKVTDIKGKISYIEAQDKPFDFDELIQTWDCAFKDKVTASKVCGLILGRKENKIYVLDCINKTMDIIETMQSIEVFAKLYPFAKTKLIEDKANGTAVIQMLSKKMAGIIPISAQKNDKIARVNAVSPLIESGCVYLPHGMLYDWVNVILSEFNKFPLGNFNDIVDAMSQGLNYLMYRNRSLQQNNEDEPTGTYSMAWLKMKGYKPHEIRKMVRDGKIRLMEGQ